MFFEWETLIQTVNLVKAIRSYLQHIIYGSTTTVITNLISLAYTSTPDLLICYLEQNLNASCCCCLSTSLMERKQLLQCSTSTQLYADTVQINTSLHIIALKANQLCKKFITFSQNQFFSIHKHNNVILDNKNINVKQCNNVKLISSAPREQVSLAFNLSDLVWQYREYLSQKWFVPQKKFCLHSWTPILLHLLSQYFVQDYFLELSF